MRIAEREQVLRHYPKAQPRAVDHVLWALHRLAPYLELGRPELALSSLSCDVMAYRHSHEELHPFGIPELAAAVGAGVGTVREVLGLYHLLYREPVT